MSGDPRETSFLLQLILVNFQRYTMPMPFGGSFEEGSELT